ncbi:DUF2189 domain-containing protein [Devosia nitrariae]|uniref:DUF2189 domain-containing protein n=1 Tax=Devosia nitrariae TaxID=2071872 RepID=A0ABQ5WAM3_9HYPH|nr:DUF2189 domain-containing protein [Devosia nitrariae]GLQ56605.1 hypothetical protein GCM10010862_38640 [Devosia nitrariae]
MALQFHQIPATVPPLPRAVDHRRRLPVTVAFGWLAAGWQDLWTEAGASLVYGLGVATLSAIVISAMFVFGWEQVLFPALAGFLVVGPVLATGLYEKSRRLAAGEPVYLSAMIWPRQSPGQHLFYVGAVLMTLMLVWMRAAVLLYALFFGWRPFPGFDRVIEMLFTTPTGIAMLATGAAVGGLFAAFAFAVSVFSIPMLLDRRLDAFSAMGSSVSLVWNNLPALLVWGAIVLALTLVSLATGLAGLVIIFPLLGHASWHAYAAVRD